MYLINSYLLLLGLVIGSFLNAAIYRYQHQEKLTKGRSHCPHCQHDLAAKDLIPVFSFIFLNGKCRYCHQKISWRYPLVEILTGFLFLLTFNKFNFTIEFVLMLVFISTCIYAAFIDFDSMIIPDRTHLIFIAIGLVLLYLDPSQLMNRLLGAIVISLPLGIIAYLTKGIGYGDVKLMASAGFVLMMPLTLVATFIGIILGGIIALGLMKFNHQDKKSAMPLGPTLIIGIIVSIFYGQQIITWYIQTFF